MQELPAEVAELRDLHDTAISNLAAAEGAYEAAKAALKEANEAFDAADRAYRDADNAEHKARTDWVAGLRASGYVRTADGLVHDPAAVAELAAAAGIALAHHGTWPNPATATPLTGASYAPGAGPGEEL